MTRPNGSGRRRFRAVSFDLDDTLWPIAPVIRRAERAVHGWLAEHHPEVAERYSVEALVALRDSVLAEHPDRAHDYAFLRRQTLGRIFVESGRDHALADTAYEVFLAERNRVELFADVLPVLEVLSERYALACISNGNACVDTIGIGHYFRVRIHAAGIGSAKPSPHIFSAASEALGVPPAETVHVGDCLEADVEGARAAGYQAVWLNRSGDGRQPPEDVAVITSLDQLPATVEALVS